MPVFHFDPLTSSQCPQSAAGSLSLTLPLLLARDLPRLGIGQTGQTEALNSLFAC